MKTKFKVYIFLMSSLLLATAADVSAQVDRREVRQGNRNFRKTEYNEAEIAYLKALTKDSLSVAANYNLANTLYRMEEYDNAKTALDRVGEAVQMSPASADYYYNLGSVAMAQKDWKTAVDALQQSLLRNPGDLNAKENYIYARKMLENQQQNQQQNQDQDQNQQDQNNDQDQNDNQNDNQQQDQQNDDQQQDQNKDQNQDDQQDKKDQQQNNQQQEPQITPQAAQQMLQAIQAKEKETQDKVKEAKAAALKSRQKEKNW